MKRLGLLVLSILSLLAAQPAAAGLCDDVLAHDSSGADRRTSFRRWLLSIYKTTKINLSVARLRGPEVIAELENAIASDKASRTDQIYMTVMDICLDGDDGRAGIAIGLWIGLDLTQPPLSQVPDE